MITQESIARVKQEASLVQLVAESIALKRSGANYFGLCPFHSERSPSFYVREHSNSYHCFGCGASGNVITYMMETRALSFPEAVEFLGQRFGIPITYDDRRTRAEPQVDREELYEIMHGAQAYFEQSLRTEGRGSTASSRAFADYVRSRGITREAIKTFGIGFAPARRTALTDLLIAAGGEADKLVLAGVSKRSSSGSLYDVFRGRLIFPIWIDSKRIVGFGGRLVPGQVSAEDEARSPKYLNSPESPLYQKSKTLYGLPQALNDIRQSGEVWVVEGYMDVVSLAMRGHRNVVACCGTALTEQHMRRLSSIAGKIYLLFDGDEAGRNAAAKAFPVSLNLDADVEVIFLPEGTDPDDFARTHGDEVTTRLRALPRVHPIESYCDRVLRENGCTLAAPPGPNLRASLAEEIAAFLAEVESDVARGALASLASRKIGVDASELRTLASRRPGDSGGAPRPAASARPEPEEVSWVEGDQREIPDVSEFSSAERETLAVVMVYREELIPRVLSNAPLIGFLSPEVVDFIQQLRDVMSVASDSVDVRKARVRALLRDFGAGWVQLWKEAHRRYLGRPVGSVTNAPTPEELLAGCVAALRRQHVEELIVEKAREVEQPGRSPEEIKRLFDQLLSLKRQLAAGMGMDQNPRNN